jgi:hypothetical protein
MFNNENASLPGYREQPRKHFGKPAYRKESGEARGYERAASVYTARSGESRESSLEG